MRVSQYPHVFPQEEAVREDSLFFFVLSCFGCHKRNRLLPQWKQPIELIDRVLYYSPWLLS